MRRARARGVTLTVTLAAAAVAVSGAAPSSIARAAPSTVVIAELMASNATTLLDEDGDASDWLELWNPTSAAVDVTGWHLTDNAANPTKWTMSARVLAPDERLVVFASNKNRSGTELHTNFALSAGGEYLAVTNAAGAVVQAYAPTFPAQAVDVSYGFGSNELIGTLEAPTPGAANTAAFPQRARPPAFNRAGGYLNGPTTVTITTPEPGATIRYTTDASTPSALHGTTYAGPIAVSGSTMLRAVTIVAGLAPSPPASLTLLDMNAVLAQGAVAPGWPAGPANGQVLQYGFDPAVIAAQGSLVRTSLEAAPTVSILTDQANLTDPTTGIYVNAQASGATSERPASVEMFGAGNDDWAMAAGVRIKGGFSRSDFNPKHSLRLSFTSAYQGPLQEELFDDGVERFVSLDLRSEQNHSWHYGDANETFLRELWTRDAQLASGEPGLRSRWVHVFLNGQYFGLYMIAERMSQTHLAEVFGGAATDYDVIATNSDDHTYETDGDDDEWRRLWQIISDQDVTDAEMAEVATLVDLRSLAVMQLLVATTGNEDATPSWFLGEVRANNWIAARGPGLPFQFFIADAEHTLGANGHDVRVDRTGPYPIGPANTFFDRAHFNPGWLYQVLWQRPEYRAVFDDAAAQLLADDGALGATASTARWDTRANEVRPLVRAEAARWGTTPGAGPFGFDDWSDEVAWVRTTWFPSRIAVVVAQLTLPHEPRLDGAATVPQTNVAVRLGVVDTPQ